MNNKKERTLWNIKGGIPEGNKCKETERVTSWYTAKGQVLASEWVVRNEGWEVDKSQPRSQLLTHDIGKSMGVK